MSGDIFCLLKLKGAPSIYWVEARDATYYPTIHRQQRITWRKELVEPSMRNPALAISVTMYLVQVTENPIGRDLNDKAVFIIYLTTGPEQGLANYGPIQSTVCFCNNFIGTQLTQSYSFTCYVRLLLCCNSEELNILQQKLCGLQSLKYYPLALCRKCVACLVS